MIPAVTFKGVDRYLEVGGRASAVIDFRERLKRFFSKEGGQGSRSTLPRTKLCKQHFVMEEANVKDAPEIEMVAQPLQLDGPICCLLPPFIHTQ